MTKKQKNNKQTVDREKSMHLPTGVPMLQLFQQKTFEDAYQDYLSEIEKTHTDKQAYAIKAKLKTALRRYTLPGFGWVFVKEETAWLNFMQTLTLQDLNQALEVQEQVFTQLKDAVSDESRRSNRSSLKRFVEYIQTQPYYYIALGASKDQLAPRMQSHKKRQEHWHRLKPKEIPSQVNDELNRLTHYLLYLRSQTSYGSTLVESTVKRYVREVLDLLSWLHRFKGEPLETLSIQLLVPRSAITDDVEAAKVAQLLQEYVEWLQSHLGLARRGQGFAVRSCIYIAELLEYEQSTGV